jgi:type IX secretion system PorP/SprF family membrane protein
MKRSLRPFLFFVLFFLGSFLQSEAQENDFTQYYLNLSGINAGFTGIEDYLDLKLGVREGWNNFGVKDNNLYVSLNGALNRSNRSAQRSNSLRLSDPGVLERVKMEKGFRRKQGLGGIITNRKVGPYQSLQINANYAYHLPITKSLNLSLGTKVGYANQRIDFGGLTVRDDTNDLFYNQLMQSQQGRQSSFLLDFGSVVYSKYFFVGVSAQNLATPKLSGDQLLAGTHKARYMLQAGSIFTLSPNLSLAPGFNTVFVKDYDLQWAANARVLYKQIGFFGLAYQSNSKVSILLGFTKSNFEVNYCYDQYLSDLRSFNISVHELVIGISLFNKYDMRPKFW